MNKVFYTLIILVVSLYGCNNTAEQEVYDTKENIPYAKHEHDETEDIVLNNGEKWVVDAEMMVHIRNMEKDIEAFKTSEEKNYSVLASQLESNIELLTSNCTMEGQAHDELHKWLIPYIETVEAFSESTKNNTGAAAQLEYIEKYFVTLNQYFE